MSIYGCWNKPRPTADSSHIAQFGWFGKKDGPLNTEKHPVYIEVKSAFGSTDCQYTIQHATDPHCSGCVHRAKEPT
jgi:hypothetical protein